MSAGMNNRCPSCGTAYKIDSSSVGRTFKCSTCSNPLAVTEAGIVVSPPRAPPQPVPSPPQNPGPLSLDDDDDDYTPGRRSRRGGSGLGDFLTFRRMIIPVIIQVVFLVLSAVVVVAGLFGGYVLATGKNGSLVGGVFVILVGIPVYLLVVRMWCELIIVIFRINDTLTDIRNLLRSRRD